MPTESQVNLMEKQNCRALENCYWLPCKVLKIRQAPNKVTYAKLYVTKPRLNYSFGSLRNEIVYLSIKNHLR